jgi:hypothetical protein
MLASQQCQREAAPRQGGRGGCFAEIRRRLASPSLVDDACRQRLQAMACRLDRIRRLGGEYARVGFSSEAAEVALGRGT